MGISTEYLVVYSALGVLVAVSIYLTFGSSRSGFPRLLILPLFLTAFIELFDLLVMLSPPRLFFLKPYTLVGEALIPLGWALSIASLEGISPLKFSRNILVSGAGTLMLAGIVAFVGARQMLFSPDFGQETLLFLGTSGLIFYAVLTVALVFVMVQLERFFISLSRQDRWVLKYEILGVGAIIATQTLYFSQGVVYRTIDMSLLPVRSAAIVIGLFLFMYARRTKKRRARLQLSQAASFRSVVLLVVSAYLVVLGLAGEGMRYLGVHSSRLILLLLALCGGVVICILVLSETLRRKTRVFLHKHFLRQKYDYRNLWLEMTAQLGGARSVEALHTAMLDMYCRTFSLTWGALYLDRGAHDSLCLEKSTGTLGMLSRFDESGSLRQMLMKRDWVLNLAEKTEGVDSATMNQLAHVDTRFVVPLWFDAGLGGVILLGRPSNSSEVFGYEDYDLMKIMGRQAAALLYNDRLARQVTDQREMAAVGRISAFVMHDLKNLVANVSLVVENARELISDRRFQVDMLETLTNTVGRMKGLIGRLKNVGLANELALEQCNLKRLVHETVSDMGKCAVTVSGEDVEVLVDREEIGKVITNLVMNGLEATGDARSVVIEVHGEPWPMLVCRDQGEGMSTDFISADLFKPFSSTKKQGLGIGLFQSRQIVEAHGGRIEVDSVIGQGSEFKVHFPPLATHELRGTHG